MNFKKITIAGFIVVLGLVAYLIWKNMNKPDTDALVSGNGRIEATEINVSSKLSGQLEEIFVDISSVWILESNTIDHVSLVDTTTHNIFCCS